jgi:methylenetetrahydrofolate reductase (NADPH)
VQRIASLCKARLPEELLEALSSCGDNAADQMQAGIDFAIAQVRGLLDAGVPGIHFYVLNKSHATASVLRAVQYEPA